MPVVRLLAAAAAAGSLAELAAGAPAGPAVTLNNGVQLPLLLWGSGGETQENSTSTQPAVRDALRAGFQGIANHYHNQDGVARGIADSGVPRDSFWLQTKVEPCGHSTITPVLEGHCYNGTLAAFRQNLDQLQVSQVDLTLLHAPPCVPHSNWADPQCYWPDQPDAVYPQHANCSAPEPCRMMREQWRALEDMYHANLTRAIGVSNFCAPCLACIAETATVTPAVNQLQFHPGMPGSDPQGLLSYCKGKSIVPQAYSPLGGDAHAALLGSPVVKTIAQAHNATVGQVCLRWIMALGYPLATSTVSPEFMREDVAALSLSWRFTDAEMAELGTLAVAPDDPVKGMCLFD